MLSDTLRRRSQTELKPTSAKTVVMICLPLQKWRFLASQWLPTWLLTLCRLKSAFLGQVSTTEEYERHIGYPIRQEVEALRRTGATVLTNVGFRTFRQILLSASSEVIFLVSHHLEKGEIEFANGGKKWPMVEEVILKAKETYHPDLGLIICNGQDWMKDLKDSGFIGSVAYAAWQMPVVPSLTFIRLCIEGFTGQNTLSEAWNRAIQTFSRIGQE